MKSIIFSLVIYKHKLDELKELFQNFIQFENYALSNGINSTFLINDNSPFVSKEIVDYISKKNISYRFNNCNLGYGKSHNYNLIRSNSFDKDDVFIIINPDILFEYKSLFAFINEFSKSKEVCRAPLIVNIKGEIQYSAKNNPSFLSLLIGRAQILRKIAFLNKFYEKHINYQADYKNNRICCPYLSGCFLIIGCEAFKKIKGFDERFFLHFEDADLTRKCYLIGDVMHDPSCTVIHKWARGSHKSLIQTFHLLISMFKYFSKWGLKII